MGKVFFIGLPKTGLSTLMSGLGEKGFRTAGSPARIYGKDISEVRKNFRRIATDHIIPAHDAFFDVPWCIEVAWLKESFPKAKYILTIRDPKHWADSYLKQFEGQLSVHHHWLLGKRNVSTSDREWLVDFCNKFNSDVEDMFYGDQTFFKLSMSTDLTWEKLSEILGQGLGTGSIPLRNPASNRDSFSWWLRRKPRTLIGSAIRRMKGSL